MSIELKQAAQQALEALQHSVPKDTKQAREQFDAIQALRTAIQQAESEPVAKAWADGYRQGIEDERTSEANIGVAGFGAKVNPSRENPYGTTHPDPGVPEDLVRDAIDSVRESYRGTVWGKAAECICDAIDAAMIAAQDRA